MVIRAESRAEGVQLPGQFNTEVLKRMFGSDKELSEFHAKYLAARRSRGIRERIEPSTLQYRLASMVKRGKKINEVATEEGQTYSQVDSALKHVAIWEYLNS